MTGIAIPVVDAVISEARRLLAGNPVVDTIRDVISIEAIEEGAPLRAADALIIVGQLEAALRPPPDNRPRGLPGYLKG